MTRTDPVPVYLVHWKSPDWVRSAVESIRGSDVPVEVVVISNSGPVDVPGAEVVDTRANLGFAGGANVAFEHWLSRKGQPPYAILGTHDLHLEPDAISIMVSAMDADRRIGICGPEMPDAPIAPARGEGVSWLMGQCLMLRADCIRDIGGFDERFGTYGEDKDLCFRAWDAGWVVARVTRAKGYGLGSVSPRARALRLGNAVGLARKREGAWPALKLLVAQPALALVNLRDAVVEPGRAGHHLTYAADRMRSIPQAVRQFRRFADRADR